MELSGYTFLPDYSIIIIYFGGLLVCFGYFLYTAYALFNYVKNIHLATIDKVKVYTPFTFAIILLVVLVLHSIDSWEYHDLFGTSPSDAEVNYRLINILFAFLMLLISNNEMAKTK